MTGPSGGAFLIPRALAGEPHRRKRPSHYLRPLATLAAVDLRAKAFDHQAEGGEVGWEAAGEPKRWIQ